MVTTPTPVQGSRPWSTYQTREDMRGAECVLGGCGKPATHLARTASTPDDKARTGRTHTDSPVCGGHAQLGFANKWIVDAPSFDHIDSIDGWARPTTPEAAASMACINGFRTHILRYHTDRTLLDCYWTIVEYQLGGDIELPEVEGNPLVELLLDPWLAMGTDEAMELVVDFTCAVALELEERGYTECTGCSTYGDRHLVPCHPAR